jgi:hypothetical protein
LEKEVRLEACLLANSFAVQLVELQGCQQGFENEVDA